MGLFDGKIKVGGIVGAVARMVGEISEGSKSKPLDPETEALIERVKNNKIFTDFADETYEQFRYEDSYPIQWILGEDPDTRFMPKLYLFAGTKSFGLYGEYLYKDSEDKYAYDGFEAMEIRLFEDLKMKDLPDNLDLKAAVVETMASRLWEAPFCKPGKTQFKYDRATIEIEIDTKKLKQAITDAKEAEKSEW